MKFFGGCGVWRVGREVKKFKIEFGLWQGDWGVAGKERMKVVLNLVEL